MKLQILVLQMRRIGDVVLTTPVLRSLREAYPEAEITLAIEAGSAGLLPCVDHDRALVFHRGRLDVKVWWRLLRSPYDICLDLTNNDRAALAAWISSASRKVTLAHKRMKRWRRRLFDILAVSNVARRHTVDHYHAILDPLGPPFPMTPPPPQIHLPPEDVEFIGRLMQQNHVLPGFILVHPGTVKEEKFWPADRWAQVVEFLVHQGHCVVLTGGPAAMERAHFRALREFLSQRLPQELLERQIRDWSGMLTLPQLAACIKQAGVVCGVDSAPLHFAEALERPVCALFGPTCPHQWRPRRTGSLVLTPLGTKEVGPEYYPGRPMEEISVDLVLTELRQWGALGAVHK